MDKDIAQAVAGQLTENGIKTNVKIIGRVGSYVRSVLDHKTEDIFMNGWCLPSLEPDHWVTPNLHTGEPVSQYSNLEVDKLMEAGPRGDEYGEAEAALQPAPPAHPRRCAVALRVPADGHLRRQQSSQADAAGTSRYG